MIGPDVIAAGCVLICAVAAGLVTHELSHALVLRSAGVDADIVFLPERRDGLLALLASCPWAVVHPTPTPHHPPWVFRLAALAPLSLLVPLIALQFAGRLATETPIGIAMTIGWLACAIPSPQDFSVAFYAERLLNSELNTPE